MAHRIVWSPQARLDLKELFSFIAEDSPSIARKFLKSIFNTVERLEDFPESGRVVPEFNELCLREILRKPCRIVYRVSPERNSIEIVRVWHSARGTPDTE